MPDLRRIEPHPVDAIEPWQRRIERRLGFRLAQMAKEAQDQLRGQPVPLARFAQRAGDPRDHGFERDSALRMPLRVEEDLDMADIVGARAGEIGRGQVVEILFGDEDAHALIIDV